MVSLKAWSRWLRRCGELGVQAPDSSLLARGLTNMVRRVLDKNQDATFRTSLVKSTLQIDSNPNHEKVESYFKHLIAECEALSVAGYYNDYNCARSKNRSLNYDLKPEPKATTTPTAPSSTAKPALLATTAGDDGKPTITKAETPCRFFGKTAKGHQGCQVPVLAQLGRVGQEGPLSELWREESCGERVPDQEDPS